VYALAARAHAQLALGDRAAAVADAEASVALLDELGEIDEGETIVRLVYAEALYENGEHIAARAAIERARDRVLALGNKIADPVLRETCLTRVPENARTLELARAWLG
jgi:hypothetical protein